MKGTVSLLEVAGALALAGVATLVLDLLLLQHLPSRGLWVILVNGIIAMGLVIAARYRERPRG